MHQKNLNLKWFQWWVEGFQKKEMFNVPLILLKIKGSTLFLPLYLTPYALKLIGQSWAHKDQLDFASPPTLPTDLTYFKLESKNRISDALLRTRHLAEAHALKAESCIPLITSDPVYQDRLRDLTVMVTRRDKWTNSKKTKNIARNGRIPIYWGLFFFKFIFSNFRNTRLSRLSNRLYQFLQGWYHYRHLPVKFNRSGIESQNGKIFFQYIH